MPTDYLPYWEGACNRVGIVPGLIYSMSKIKYPKTLHSQIHCKM